MCHRLSLWLVSCGELALITADTQNSVNRIVVIKVEGEERGMEGPVKVI